MYLPGVRLRLVKETQRGQSRLGPSNSRLEGIDAKIRLIQRRGYGHRNLDSLTAMIHLCLGGIAVTLSTEG
jgi:transposase